MKFPRIAIVTLFLTIVFCAFSQTNSTQIEPIEEKENVVMLEEAVVVGQKAEVIVKQDTTEYNVEAFRMQESAVAEDLLKRLPGVEVSETGVITVQGKEVKKVLVDGKDFFQGDPTMATRNIPAEIMEKLQIIDDKSELAKLTGIDDGEENTVINITIKKGMKKGWITNSSVGMGKEIREPHFSEGPVLYEANSFVTRILDDTQIGIVANGNNVNLQRFTTRGGRGEGGGSSSGGNASMQQGGGSGINSSISAGLTFAREKNKNFKQGGEITYGFSQRDVQQKSLREMIVDRGGGMFREASDTTRQQSHDLRFNYKMEYKPTEKWTIQLSPTVSYSKTFSDNRSQTLNTDSLINNWNSELPNNQDVNFNSKHTTSAGNALDLGLVFTAAKDFEKKGRKLSFNVETQYSYSNTNGTNLSSNIFYNPAQAYRSRDMNQQSKIVNNSITARGYISYIEPLGNNNFLQGSYWARYNMRDNIRETDDIILDTIPETGEIFIKEKILNPVYSKSLSNEVLTQQLSLSFRAVREKYNLTIGADYNPSITKSHQFIKNGASDRSDSTVYYYPMYTVLNNVAPNLDYLYKFTKTQNLRATYRGRTRAPSITQMDPTRDSTSLTNIRFGNPNLKPTFTHTLRLRYSDYEREKQQAFAVTMDASYIMNNIVNQTNYSQDGSGIRETSPVNVNGSWNGSMQIMYNRPIGKMFQINNFTNIRLRNDIGFTTINNESTREVAFTSAFSQNIGVTFRNDWLYLQVRATYMPSNTNYSTEGKPNVTTHNYGGALNMRLTLPKNWSLGSDVRYAGMSGYSSGYNRNQTIWNAELSKQFLKNNAATVRLRVSDILQQQKNIVRNTASDYFEDVEYNTLSSYFILTFAYRFNSLGGSAANTNNSNNAPQGFGGEQRGNRGGEGGMRMRDGGF